MATITKSIGTDTRDYSTITAWEAALGGAAGGAGNDAVGECYADSDFDESLDVNDATPNSITLKPADGEMHDGTANTGVRIIGSSDNYQFDADCGYILVDGLEFDMNGTSKYATYQINLQTGPVYFNRCIVHDAIMGNGSYQIIKMSDDNYASNCIFYDFVHTGASTYTLSVLNLDYATASDNQIYNCTVDRASSGNLCYGLSGRWTNAGRKCINTAITNITATNTAECFHPNSNWVITNNLDDDSTLPDSDGNLLGKEADDQYVSRVDGSEDYHLKAGADAINAGTDLGTTPTGVNIDINGFDRDASGRTWDIGVHEYIGSPPTFSIGTNKRDYSTITAWEANLSNTDIYLSQDAVGECYADSDFDESITINDGIPDSILLTSADGEQHDGTANSGVRWKTTASRNVTAGSTASPITISFIEFDWNGHEGIQDCTMYLDGSSVGPITHTCANCIVHHQDGLSSMFGIYAIDPGRVINNIIYRCGKDHDKDRSVYGITITSSSGDEGSVYNNTIYGIYSNQGLSPCGGIAIDDDVAVKNVKNNIVCGTTGTTSGTIADYIYAGITSSTVDYNLSSDDSLPDSLHNVENKSAANQFVSITDGSEDLHLKSGADAINAGTDLGTTPTGVNIDINGFDRDASGMNWDMGAHEYIGSSPTFSIGTNKRDYSTITAWEADLDSEASYDASDDAVGNCYDDSTFDENVVIDGGVTLALNSIALTVNSEDRHDGTAGTGVTLTLTGGDYTGYVLLLSDVEMNTTIEWLEITFEGGAYYRSLLRNNRSTSCAVTSKNLLLRDCVTTRSSTGYYSSSYCTQNILNCIVYNIEATLPNPSSAYPVIGISLNNGAGTQNCLNNTVYNIVDNAVEHTAIASGIYGIDRSGQTVRNNIVCDVSMVSTGPPVCYSEMSPSLSTYDHNLASDSTATGTGSLTSKTATNQFVSITGGSEDLHLKSGADAIDAGIDLGTTPTGVNIDINGRDRNSEGDTWDMGAHEFVAPPPPPPSGEAGNWPALLW